MQGELRATARARVWPNAMHVITGLLAAADRERERGKIFNPMTAAEGTRTFDRRSRSVGVSLAEEFFCFVYQYVLSDIRGSVTLP